jgi:hypothetical protein
MGIAGQQAIVEQLLHQSSHLTLITAGELGQALLCNARVALAQLQHAQQHGRSNMDAVALQLVAQGLLHTTKQGYQGFQGL